MTYFSRNKLRFWMAVLFGLSFTPVFASEYLTYHDGLVEYERGNFSAAFATFRRLADGGDVASQSALAHMYVLGESVEQDYAAAAMWFRRAANQGDAQAQFSLADLYLRGLGVAQSDVDAYMWFSLSAALAPQEEQKRLALAHRGQIARQLSMTERAEGRQRACGWWRKYRATPPDASLGACGAE